MIHVNEPQVWTLIGVFAAGMFGMAGMMATLFTRVLRAEIIGLRGELTGEINGLRAEMHAGFARIDTRLDHVDRNVQTVFKRVFPEPPDAG